MYGHLSIDLPGTLYSGAECKLSFEVVVPHDKCRCSKGPTAYSE